MGISSGRRWRGALFHAEAIYGAAGLGSPPKYCCVVYMIDVITYVVCQVCVCCYLRFTLCCIACYCFIVFGLFCYAANYGCAVSLCDSVLQVFIWLLCLASLFVICWFAAELLKNRIWIGWRYLSNATCLIRPHLYVLFVVSRIIIICQLSRRF